MINDIRYDLYMSYGNLLRLTYSNPSNIFNNYLSYSLYNKIKDNGGFKNSKIIGFNQNHIYSVFRNSSFFTIYDMDLENQELYLYSNSVSQSTNTLCFANSNTLVCPDYVSIIQTGTNYDYLNPLFENGSFGYVATEYANLKVGTSYLDDLMYTNKSTDILVYGFYLFIPILLFIFAIKVFRKGMFK